MVIDGTADVIGSDRAAVRAAVAAAKPVAVAPVIFAADQRSVTIGIGASPAGGTVLLARYVLSRTTPIGGGENANRTATDFNAVEHLEALGIWVGKSVSYKIEPPGEGEGIAVLVQAPDGSLLGAASLTPAS
jgi:hypothetical protein